MELWARNRNTKKYEFIKNISYENRFYEVDQIDASLFYEVMVIDNQSCILYIELEMPKKLIRR